MHVKYLKVTAFPTSIVTKVVSDVSRWLAGWLLVHPVSLLGSHLPSKILELLLQGGCRVPLPPSCLHGIRNTAPLFVLKLLLNVLLALDQLGLLFTFTQLAHIIDTNTKLDRKRKQKRLTSSELKTVKFALIRWYLLDKVLPPTVSPVAFSHALLISLQCLFSSSFMRRSILSSSLASSKLLGKARLPALLGVPLAGVARFFLDGVSASSSASSAMAAPVASPALALRPLLRGVTGILASYITC